MDKQNSTLNDKEKTPKTVSLSVPKGFSKEFVHLNNQPNKSQYVWRLIRDDMNKQIEDVQILEIVREVMKDVNLYNVINKGDKWSS